MKNFIKEIQELNKEEESFANKIKNLYPDLKSQKNNIKHFNAYI